MVATKYSKHKYQPAVTDVCDGYFLILWFLRSLQKPKTVCHLGNALLRLAPGASYSGGRTAADALSLCSEEAACGL